jgi:hypothetical protein
MAQWTAAPRVSAGESKWGPSTPSRRSFRPVDRLLPDRTRDDCAPDIWSGSSLGKRWNCELLDRVGGPDRSGAGKRRIARIDHGSTRNAALRSISSVEPEPVGVDCVRSPLSTSRRWPPRVVSRWQRARRARVRPGQLGPGCCGGASTAKESRDAARYQRARSGPASAGGGIVSRDDAKHATCPGRRAC